MNENGIWHYSIANYIPQILRTKNLKLATKNIPKRERPAVWFSTNQVWEQTANKSYFNSLTQQIHFGTKETTLKYGEGLIRIGVAPETAPYNWKQYKKMSRIKKAHAKGLVETALNNGADPDEWRVSFKQIPVDKFLAIQLFFSEKIGWTDISKILTFGPINDNTSFSEILTSTI